MPLSEHEQRLLDQIERGLYAEDPKFAQTVQARDPRKHYRRRMVQAALGFVAGVCLLMAGVILKLIPISVIGFVVMLACCVWGLSSWKRMTGIGSEKASAPSGDASSSAGEASTSGRKQPKSPRSSRPARPARQSRGNRGTFMERMEERWRRRREGGR